MTERHIEHHVSILVNGATVPGMRIDTDPHVLGLGGDLGDHGVLTAVLDREALLHLTTAFTTRPID